MRQGTRALVGGAIAVTAVLTSLLLNSLSTGEPDTSATDNRPVPRSEGPFLSTAEVREIAKTFASRWGDPKAQIVQLSQTTTAGARSMQSMSLVMGLADEREVFFIRMRGNFDPNLAGVRGGPPHAPPREKVFGPDVWIVLDAETGEIWARGG